MEKGKSSSKVKKTTNGRGKHPLTPACVMWVHPATARESSPVAEHHHPVRGHRRPAGWCPGCTGRLRWCCGPCPLLGSPLQPTPGRGTGQDESKPLKNS